MCIYGCVGVYVCGCLCLYVGWVRDMWMNVDVCGCVYVYVGWMRGMCMGVYVWVSGKVGKKELFCCDHLYC